MPKARVGEKMNSKDKLLIFTLLALVLLIIAGCEEAPSTTGKSVQGLPQAEPQKISSAVLTFVLENNQISGEFKSGATIGAFVEAQNTGTIPLNSLKVQFVFEDPSIVNISYDGQTNLQYINLNDTINPQEQTQRKKINIKMTSKIQKSETLLTAVLLDKANKKLDRKYLTLVIKK